MFESIAYHVSTAAMHPLTRSAADTLAPEIRVNTITPGIAATAMAGTIGRGRIAAAAGHLSDEPCGTSR